MALKPTAVIAFDRVTVVPLTLLTTVPVGMPRPVTLMPAKTPPAVDVETVTVVAAAVTLTADWVTPSGAGLNATFDAPVAVAAVERMTEPTPTEAIVVPGASPVPLTYMPARRPVVESTGSVVLALVALAGTEVIAAPAAGPKTNVLVPPKVGAAERVMVVPTTLVTSVPPASVPVPPAARLTVDPGMMLVPAGTVKVVPVVNVWLTRTWEVGKP